MRLPVLIACAIGTVAALHVPPAGALSGDYLSQDVPLSQGMVGAVQPNPLLLGAHSPSGFGLLRVREVLQKVDDQARLVTRGAKEAQLYRQISPSVVLIVTDTGLGSGSLIGNREILTNWHVVQGAPEVGVVFKPSIEGRQPTAADVVKGVVVRVDAVVDLALVSLPGGLTRVKPIELGTSAEIEVGADVHAIGHPTGEAWTYTRGIISQYRRNYRWNVQGEEHQADVIQTQTPINPGNSGGPLLSNKGHLIGVNTFKAEGEGLNFAVSVEDVGRFLSASGDKIVRNSSPPSSCQAHVLYKGRNKSNDAYIEWIDGTCGGKGNVLLTIPDDVRRSISLKIDTCGTGSADIMIFDADHDWDRDHRWDYSLHRTKCDGPIDVIGYHPDGDMEPSRYELYRGQPTPWAN